MASKLTATAIKNFKSPSSGQVIHWDTVVSYFGVRVGKSGVRAFIVKPPVLVDGVKKKKTFTLGRFSETDPNCLSEAREKAQWYVEEARKGNDPAAVAQSQDRDLRRRQVEADREAALQEKNTFAVCRDKFIEAGERHGIKKRGRPWSAKTAQNNRWALGKCVDWSDIPINEINRGMIQDLIDRVEQEIAAQGVEHRSGLVTAYRVHNTLMNMLSWCVRRGYIELSPCQGIEVPDKVRRERVLDDDELKAIWHACVQHGGPLTDAFRVLILTGQRRSEIGMLRWDEVELTKATISLEGSRTKNSLPHVVPLSPLTSSIIDAQPRLGEFVFTTKGRAPISGYSKVKARIAEMAGVHDWRIHDFRRTMVTNMNEMEIAPHVVEAVVNHISGDAKRGVAGIYNKAQYLRQREQALNAWSERVEAITGGSVKCVKA